MASIRHLPSIQILGNRIHMVELPDVVDIMDRWIANEPQLCHHVVNTGMHGIMEAHRNPEFKALLKDADLWAPDGISVILVACLRGFSIKKRNTGPDLLWRFGRVANEKGYKYFIYGDTQETIDLLASKLTESFPMLRIVGLLSPPFRPLTPEEDESIVRTINEAAPDILWVGLGMPKQEQWISQHRNRLQVPVVVGAGASFKFLSGTVRRAPHKIRNVGLEWLWRLGQEPRGMWRRVFIDAPQFLGLVALELSGLKRYGP